jgi:hypothetical protein
MSVPLALLVLAASSPAFDGPAVSDQALSTMRGGFSLPGGLAVSIAVQTDTRVDGALLLRSVYRVDQGAPTLSVYAPDGSASSQNGQPRPTNEGAPAQVGVSFDRSNGVSIVTRPGFAPTISITTGNGPANIDAGPPIAATIDGPGTQVAGGVLTIRSLPGGDRIQLQGDNIDISHLVGMAFGSVIQNTASDRAIDTATVVSMGISGANISNLGSAASRIESLGLDSVSQMMPR